MQKSPNKDKDFNVMIVDNKFRDIRHKAQEDYIQRKTRRDRLEANVRMPEFKIGQQAVLTQSSYSYKKSSKKYYLLVEVVDFHDIGHYFVYYAITLKVTKNGKHYEIGRLMHFDDRRFSWGGLEIVNVPPNSIRWDS